MITEAAGVQYEKVHSVDCMGHILDAIPIESNHQRDHMF